MSVVAVRRIGRNRFEIAADSIGVWGNTCRVDKNGKLWRINNHLVVGSCGFCSIGTLLRDFIARHAPKRNVLSGWLEFAKVFHNLCRQYDLKVEDNNFLIVCRGKAWMINGLHVSRIDKYEACGAGRDYALAALYLGCTAKRACEVAAALCIHCSKPVKVLEA